MPSYLVRILQRVEADSPADAAEAYMQDLANTPLRQYVCRVEEADNPGNIVYVFQGQEVDIQEMARQMADKGPHARLE